MRMYFDCTYVSVSISSVRPSRAEYQQTLRPRFAETRYVTEVDALAFLD